MEFLNLYLQIHMREVIDKYLQINGDRNLSG